MMNRNLDRGAAPIGYVSELGPIEAGAVLHLRRWCEGPEAWRSVSADLSAAVGPEQARRALGAFEELCNLCALHGRRPLMRHDPGCQCLGSDEACFANFIAVASEGEREDAILIATMIVRADMAPCLAGLAETFGLVLRRMAVRARPKGSASMNSTTLH